ncbi:hypothetical protein [Zhongshania aliphaticivorans]|uniref:hypothetical protein n=1 Tax=Zhongshania aliphaticivorans TaxID=1470434 RepID=UPI00257383DB|nr:hypothetical protein [Zhongshania aliphaticivorans]
MRAELEDVGEQMILVLSELALLTGESIEAEQITELRASIASAPDDEVAEILENALNAIAMAEQEIERLKTSPPESDDSEDVGDESVQLRSQFYDLYSMCNSQFRKYKKSQEIFKNSPCSEHEERVEMSIYHADNKLEKIEAYQEGIATLTAIYKQLAETDAEELVRIYEQAKSFNVSHNRIVGLVGERENLEKSLTPIIEKMDNLRNRAESYVDDASLNCRAEQVDFDCGNRCQRSVKDPIFGTYRNEPDMRCLNSCNFQEQQAIDDVNEQIDDCIDERDWASDKLETLESEYNSARSNALSLSNQFDRVNDEIKSLINVNKSVNGELDQFLGQLHPVVFYAMNDEIGRYVMNAMSYQSD